MRMPGRMYLGVVVTEVVFPLVPVDIELPKVVAVSHPIVPHVGCAEAGCLDGVLNETFGCCVVCFNWGGRLFMA